jgi:hypothetical protein
MTVWELSCLNGWDRFVVGLFESKEAAEYEVRRAAAQRIPYIYSDVKIVPIAVRGMP